MAGLYALLIGASFAQPYRVLTVAGRDHLQENGLATTASFLSPRHLAMDGLGNVYVSDQEDHRVRRISSSGVIKTIAGTGIPGYSGDGGPGQLAQLSSPGGIATDRAGNLYVADRNNHRVRRISAVDGTITTAAGNGNRLYLGDGYLAAEAQFDDPEAIALDKNNNLFIAARESRDAFYGDLFRILRVDGVTGLVTTLAGPFTALQVYPIYDIFDMAVDNAGVLYVATGYTIVKIPGGAAGGVLPVNLVSGPGIQFYASVALDARGYLYFADRDLPIVRRLDLSNGTVIDIAGTGTPGFSGDGAAALSATLSRITSIMVGPDGSVDVLDSDLPADCCVSVQGNRRVRRVDPMGIITTIAGSSESPANASGLGIDLIRPTAINFDSSGNLLIADTGDNSVRAVSPAGSASVIMNSQSAIYNPSTGGGLFDPKGVTTMPGGDYLLAAGENPYLSRLLKGPRGGPFTSLSAFGTAPGGYPDSTNQLVGPSAVTADSFGNIFISDQRAVKRINVAGTYSTVIGGTQFADPDLYVDPVDVAADSHGAIDAHGAIYVADRGHNRVLKVVSTGQSTVAGTGEAGYNGDSGRATAIQLNGPTGVAIDSNDNLYIADFGNRLIRKVDPNGTMTTVAGSRTATGYQELGSASAVAISPYRLAVDRSGNIYFNDFASSRIRRLTPTGQAKLQISTGDNQTGAPGAEVAIKVQALAAVGVPAAEVPVTFSIVSGTASLRVSSLATDTNGEAMTTVVLGATPGPVRIAASAIDLPGVSFNLNISQPIVIPVPRILGIVGAGLSAPPLTALSPSGLATIFGDSFAASGTAVQVGSSDIKNGALPTSLGGVCISIGGLAAFPVAVFPTQINFQVPAAGTGMQTVQVIANCGTATETRSLAAQVLIQSVSPEFFYFTHNTNGRNPIAAVNSLTGAYVGSEQLLPGVSFVPAKPGDYISLFGTGFGATTPPFQPGQIPGVAGTVVGKVLVTLNGVQLSPDHILYAGTAPGNAGLFQLNIRIPDDATPGDASLQLQIDGVSTPVGSYLHLAQ